MVSVCESFGFVKGFPEVPLLLTKVVSTGFGKRQGGGVSLRSGNASSCGSCG